MDSQSKAAREKFQMPEFAKVDYLGQPQFLVYIIL